MIKYHYISRILQSLTNVFWTLVTLGVEYEMHKTVGHNKPSPPSPTLAGFVAGLVNNIISPYISPQH